MPPFKSSCRHLLGVNKGEAEKTSLEPSLSQNEAFQVVPVMKALVDLTSEEAGGQSQAAQDRNESSSSEAVQDGLLEKVSIVKCTSCDKSVGLIIDGNFHSLQSLLYNNTKPDGWSQVKGDGDKLALFILNQIVYREYEIPDEDELQVEYAYPHESDFVKILWINGSAVGFYTMKPKGSMDFESMDWYRMTVLDTIFVRNSERRKGYALSAIEDILSEFPDQNIGFSIPISLPMIQVLKKHLVAHPADRMKLWEIDGCGQEGNCQILWFLFKSR